MRTKDSENAQLRREAYGVDVQDVEEDETRVVEVGEAGAESALKRMRRVQVAEARVAGSLQTGFEEVKREQAEEEEARR